MVGYAPDAPVAFTPGSVIRARLSRYLGDYGLEYVDVEVGLLALHERGDALKAETGIDVLLGEFDESASVVPLILGKDEVPELDETVAVAGGVSANSALRNALRRELDGGRVFFPPLEYCVDNGAMIAYVGWMKLREGGASPLETAAVANLELQ